MCWCTVLLILIREFSPYTVVKFQHTGSPTRWDLFEGGAESLSLGASNSLADGSGSWASNINITLQLVSHAEFQGYPRLLNESAFEQDFQCTLKVEQGHRAVLAQHRVAAQ
jgi:hypothetical protein